MSDLKNKILSKLKSPSFEDHKVLSRRDLIKFGILAGGGALMPLGFATRALAQNAQLMPFLVFDLAGGAGLPANFLVGKAGGPEDLCANYRQHGWNPRASDSLDRTFGVPMAKNSSRLLAGLQETLPAELLREGQTKFKMATICNFSLDDTPVNRGSALTMISKAGLKGIFMNSGIGQKATLSGGNTDAYLPDSKFKPKLIRNLRDVVSLTSFGMNFEELPSESRREIFNQLKRAARDIPKLRDIYEDLSRFGLSEPKMDPRTSAEIKRVYNLDQGIEQLQVEAAIAHNVLNGYTGPGVITIDGCDYHDNTQVTGDAKDFEIGRSIGNAVHAAYVLNKPLFFQIVSDGGVYASSSDNYERRWVGDDPLHSLSVMGYFNPKKPVEQRRLQIGHYTDNAKVEFKTIVGEKPEKMAVAVIANYLELNGLLGQAEALTGLRLQPYDTDQMLAFA